jgi:hypothetical protein
MMMTDDLAARLGDEEVAPPFAPSRQRRMPRQ